ncbi:MAG: transglutaminase domain-containing protein [Lachnospiraceae bacterium]
MKKLSYDYYMKIGYSIPVENCHFTIKCFPQNTDRQSVLTQKIEISAPGYSEGNDGLGNRQIYGSVECEHDIFVFHTTGEVESGLRDYEEPAVEEKIGMFRYAHGCNVPGMGLRNYFEELVRAQVITDGQDDLQKSIALMHRLYQDFKYEKNKTTMSTTAEQAWQIGAGVCQDYAHILIALCQMAGIPARYVTGMLIGEGASHAWVEVLAGERWYPLDPTNDCTVTDSHIKIGTGRDAGDCLINRGIMHGGGTQTQEIRVTVAEID